MKFVILTIILIQLSCRKDPPPLPSIYWGTVSFQKNGHLWTGSPLATIYQNKIGIQIDSVPEAIIEHLSIHKIPISPGTYPIYSTYIQIDDGLSGAYYSYITFDESKGDYDILESDSSSFVTLESYDTITKEIKGRFDLIFTKADPPHPIGAPDTIRMTDGVFHTKVLN
jgi:hypothetical protein